MTLVFVTLYYAKQTQNLVQQERNSLDDQKKKNRADFWEKRLREYFIPLRIALIKLQGLLSHKPLPSDEIKKSISEFGDLFAKAILISKETMNLSSSFMEEFINFRYLKKKEIPEEKWADDTLKKSKDLMEQIEVEILLLEKKINELFSFKIDEKLAKILEDFRKEFRMYDEKKKRSASA